MFMAPFFFGRLVSGKILYDGAKTGPEFPARMDLWVLKKRPESVGFCRELCRRMVSNTSCSAILVETKQDFWLD
jgi:hypothetical protein